MKRLAGLVRRCMDDYSMVTAGDKIAVGLSGGKDSIAILCAMKQLQRYYPERFELIAIAVDLGFGMDYSKIAAMCEEMDVPFIRIETKIKEIVFDYRQEGNPCSLCAKLRKGALVSGAKESGCSKIALGHHRNDAVETMLMSLIFEGHISCFPPVKYLEKHEITQIRPMLYVGEKMAENVVLRRNLPVLKNECPADGNSKRQEIKKLLTQLDDRYPGIRERIFDAMQRLPLDGWERNGHLPGKR